MSFEHPLTTQRNRQENRPSSQEDNIQTVRAVLLEIGQRLRELNVISSVNSRTVEVDPRWVAMNDLYVRLGQDEVKTPQGLQAIWHDANTLSEQLDNAHVVIPPSELAN